MRCNTALMNSFPLPISGASFSVTGCGLVSVVSIFFYLRVIVDMFMREADPGQGKKVMISLGGGGRHFTLADPSRVSNFISSVTSIVTEFGLDGIDIDFESPSLSIDPGDTDFKHPTTPSIVISGKRSRACRGDTRSTWKPKPLAIVITSGCTPQCSMPNQ